MWFNTYTYGVFLVIVLALFALLPPRGRQIMLLIASYVFYCWAHAIYGTLLLVSTVMDYGVGLWLERCADPRRRRGILLISIIGNLGLLGFFKYADFFRDNMYGLANLLGFEVTWVPWNILLPAGISFYTFQTMSYTIQVYRRQFPAERDLLLFALYVSFFPQLVAGPIERATHLLPQLKVFRRVTFDDWSYGIMRIIFGLFRKLVLADRYAIVANAVFANPDAYSPLTVWTGLLAFGFQIYFDFAGYVDIAIGSARLFGVNLTENFNRPLVAHSIADFWNRWHMTLTGWMRDYVFQPLGGFRKGGARAAFNGGLVLILCGLWHGASWHFVLWGMYHAVMLALYYAWKYARRSRGIKAPKVRRMTPLLLLSICATILCTSLSGVFFRSPDLAAAGRMFQALFGLQSATPAGTDWFFFAIFAAITAIWMTVECLQEYWDLDARVRRWPWTVRVVGLALVLLAVTLLAVNMDSPYIYFQF